MSVKDSKCDLVKDWKKGTYMVCDMDDWASTMILSLEVITVVAVVYSYVDVKDFGECSNLNVVCVGAIARHAFKM